ncbi:MAG: aminopeptidase P N-terminal domain-containing protein [Acidobacteriota bacterium]
MSNANQSTQLVETVPQLAREKGRQGCSPATFAARREEFLRRLGRGGAILRSAPTTIRSNDSDYRYRQDSDFYYLTGLEEPDSVCLLLPEHPEHKFVLFVRPRNPERETWDGLRVGPEAACARFGADAAYSIEQLDELLPKYLEKVEIIHYRFGRDRNFDEKIFDLLKHFRLLRQRTGEGPCSITDIAEILHEMRLYKNPEEVMLMQRAADIAAQAHIAAMRTLRPGMYEFEIEAILEHHFRRGGARAPAYTSIVGAGRNATILHYNENNQQILDGELLLVDAGAEYEYYCSDITRTYPANGRFTPPQREIYEIVLAAQLAAIAQVAPGVRFVDVHQCALNVLVEGLLRLGLLSGEKEQVIEEGLYRKFYMHRTSHWLGVDVHDVGKYQIGGESRRFQAGMVLTVEPGIYIGELPDVPAQYHNIGVRIEDDILVTEEGREVLTARAPKEIAELESLIGQGGFA